MDEEGDRFALDYTRQCVKDAIIKGQADNSKNVLNILEGLLD